MKKIKKILKVSRKVIKNSSLPNGAIIASDVNSLIYPKDVKWYGYVWPRDASFISYAADLIGLHKIPRNFFRWCIDYAEDFLENGIFIANKYYPNGRVAGDFDFNLKISDLKSKKLINFYRKQQKVKLFYYNFQPDETASVLWAVYEHSKFGDVTEFKELVQISADGICKYWKKDHFIIPTYDIWEEHAAIPELKQVHTYSLAMCIKGLECASQLVTPKSRWKLTIKEMRRVLVKCYSKKLGYFVRTFGKKNDNMLDTSMLGLVWPSEQFTADDFRIVKTIRMIEKKNKVNGGLVRYQKDKYDGRIKNGDLVLDGGGSWPILNFWMSIYFKLLDKRRKSLRYFNWVIENIEDYIPEQIKDKKVASIIPLTWSHAMFIVSGKFLNLF